MSKTFEEQIKGYVADSMDIDRHVYDKVCEDILEAGKKLDAAKVPTTDRMVWDGEKWTCIDKFGNVSIYDSGEDISLLS